MAAADSLEVSWERTESMRTHGNATRKLDKRGNLDGNPNGTLSVG